MHDLLRAYGAELAADRDPDDGRREVLTRLIDHYLNTARHAAGILFPAEFPAGAGPAGRAEQATAWLDAERANLTAVTVYVTLGRYQEAERHFRYALRLSGEAADPPGQVRALLSLSHLHLHMGAYGEATSTCRQGLELSRIREPRALRIRGLIAGHQGRYRQATRWLLAAIQASRQTDDQVCLTDSLISLGDMEVRHGRGRHARRHLERARTTARQIGYVVATASVRPRSPRARPGMPALIMKPRSPSLNGSAARTSRPGPTNGSATSAQSWPATWPQAAPTGGKRWPATPN
jgi:tetratricopeptide (TPR) repeat protein